MSIVYAVRGLIRRSHEAGLGVLDSATDYRAYLFLHREPSIVSASSSWEMLNHPVFGNPFNAAALKGASSTACGFQPVLLTTARQ
jgi:hypothetical protein